MTEPRPVASDLDVLRAMLDRAGIVYSHGPVAAVTVPGYYLDVQAEEGEHNKGYHGFRSELWFDDDGALTDWATWE